MPVTIQITKKAARIIKAYPLYGNRPIDKVIEEIQKELDHSNFDGPGPDHKKAEYEKLKRTRPKNGADVIALPEYDPFSGASRVDGKDVIGPVELTPMFSKHDIMFARDKNGVAWSPVAHEGKWMRSRRNF